MDGPARRSLFASRAPIEIVEPKCWVREPSEWVFRERR
jgi:hypothetical protein